MKTTFKDFLNKNKLEALNESTIDDVFDDIISDLEFSSEHIEQLIDEGADMQDANDCHALAKGVQSAIKELQHTHKMLLEVR